MSTDAVSQQDVNISDHSSLLAQGKGSHGNHVATVTIAYYHY